MNKLNLYRRHTAKCSQKRPARSTNRQSEESPRYGWKLCDCPIYVSGTLKDGFERRNTGCTSWVDAKAVAAKWEEAGSWNGAVAVPVPAPTPTTKEAPAESPTTTKIEEAMKVFVRRAEDRGIKEPTLRKYRTFTKQFREWCETKGYVTTGQLQLGDGDLFYGTWKDGPRAAGRKLERFRKLVKLFMKRKWIEHDMGVFDIESPMGSNDAADRFPFTDDELERLYKACDDLGEVHWKNQNGVQSWSGQDVKEFLVLSVHTGLRISDAATFDVKERMDGNDIWIRALKNGTRMFTWVEDWVRDILLERQKKFGNKIFQVGKSQKLETVTDLWRRKLEKVFEVAQRDGKFATKPVPHRLRYTFVRILLQNGVPVPDVAELTGDTEEVIRKYYAKWIPERQERLRKILKESFQKKPKLVVIRDRKQA